MCVRACVRVCVCVCVCVTVWCVLRLQGEPHDAPASKAKKRLRIVGRGLGADLRMPAHHHDCISIIIIIAGEAA